MKPDRISRGGGIQGLAMSPSGHARGAFSLIEMIVVIAGLQVFLALAVGVLWGALRIERTASADFQRLLVQGALADQFRTDVAAASSAPRTVDQTTVGPRRLVLRQPNGKQILYRWDGEHLERSVSAGAAASRQFVPLGAEQVSVEFTRTGDGRLITLRLTETRGQGSTRWTNQVEFSAALGGDLQ